jgi:hypothetical protein
LLNQFSKQTPTNRHSPTTFFFSHICQIRDYTPVNSYLDTYQVIPPIRQKVSQSHFLLSLALTPSSSTSLPLPSYAQEPLCLYQTDRHPPSPRTPPPRMNAVLRRHLLVTIASRRRSFSLPYPVPVAFVEHRHVHF